MSTANYFIPLESLSPRGELIISFIVPDRKYFVSSISENLPEGVSLSDFPEYEVGDLIRVIVVEENGSSIPGDAELVHPMELYEFLAGNYVDVMVYSVGDQKFNIVRSSKRYN